MNATSDTTADASNGESFDPQQAAELLGQTTQKARRQLEPSPPWLLAIRAVAVLATLGAVWLSVRGQHPYTGPTASIIPVVIAFVILNFVATVGWRRHATAGVTGRTRFTPAEVAIMTATWVLVIVVLIGLAAAGVNIKLHPTTVLLVPGAAYAILMAIRADWRRFAVGAAVTIVGLAGLFATAAGSWLVGGVGLCLVLLGAAASVLWQRRSLAAAQGDGRS
jgi:hypothetical protein